MADDFSPQSETRDVPQDPAPAADAPAKPRKPRATKQPAGGFDFSSALALLKSNQRIARQGWNGKGMHLFLVHGWGCNEVPLSTPCDRFIAMLTAGSTVVPWLASQTDLLASDWVLVAD